MEQDIFLDMLLAFLLSPTKVQNFYHITNQIVIKYLNIWRHSLTYPCDLGHLARTDTIITHRFRYKSLPLSFLAFRAIILNLKYELTAQRYEEYLKPPNDLKKKKLRAI